MSGVWQGNSGLQGFRIEEIVRRSITNAAQQKRGKDTCPVRIQIPEDDWLKQRSTSKMLRSLGSKIPEDSSNDLLIFHDLFASYFSSISHSEKINSLCFGKFDPGRLRNFQLIDSLTE